MQKWLIGCLNSALKQAAKLALAILTSYTVGIPLNIKTLVITVSVGLVWGIFEYVLANPIPDGSPAVMISVKPDSLKPTLQDLSEK